MEFIDTHTHLSDEAFAADLPQAVDRALKAGVRTMLHPDVDSSERPGMLEVCERYPGVLYPMIGLYPGSVKENWKDELDLVLGSDASRFVAVGEIGLDYHFDTTFRREQIEALRIQLEFAAKVSLPVNIHLRDATEDFFKVLDDCRSLGLRGNLHAFSGSCETFARLQKYGDWSVGIGGVLTFRKARIAEDLKNIPLDRILLETDSPYLAPTPLRGKRNESCNIPIIAAAIAQIKGIGVEEVAEVTTENAKKLFTI